MSNEYDVFISYASEDSIVAEKLAKNLTERGLQVWLDKISITIGDSLVRSVDKGIGNSHFGVVIISRNFLSKSWTQRELNGLFIREMDEGRKIILPIWHEIEKNEIAKYSTPLADKHALKTSDGISLIGEKIAAQFSPPTYQMRLSEIDNSRGYWYRNLDFHATVSNKGTVWTVLERIKLVADKEGLEGVNSIFRIDDLIPNSLLETIQENDVQLETLTSSHPRKIERFFRFLQPLSYQQEKTITYIRQFKKLQPQNLSDYFSCKESVRCERLNIGVTFDNPPEKLYYRISDRAESLTFEKQLIELNEDSLGSTKIVQLPNRNLTYAFLWEYKDITF